MDALSCARAVSGPVGALGGKFMLDPATFQRGEELGFTPGFEYYFGGRFGVLGAVAPDVIASAAVFINPVAVKQVWAAAVATAEPAATAVHYAGACAQHGRDHLADGDHLDRFVELAQRVVDAAGPFAAPIFAGWRALDAPPDRQGRANYLLHLLRELRMARHCVAVLGAGLTPLEAVLAGAGGEANAKMFQWSAPFPEVTTELIERRAQAEQRTDELSANDYAVLNDRERSEFVALCQKIQETWQ